MQIAFLINDATLSETRRNLLVNETSYSIQDLFLELSVNEVTLYNP